MLLDGSFSYGAFDNDKLVAVINANKNLDYYPMYENNPYYHLETFIVRKEYQNLGIGTNLIMNVIRFLKESGCSYIHMQSDNKYVYRIAKKCGLVESIKDMRMDFVHVEENEMHIK